MGNSCGRPSKIPVSEVIAKRQVCNVNGVLFFLLQGSFGGCVHLLLAKSILGVDMCDFKQPVLCVINDL